jgi:hypothetical protein
MSSGVKKQFHKPIRRQTMGMDNSWRTCLRCVAAVVLAVGFFRSGLAQIGVVDKVADEKIWKLLDNEKAVYVSLPEADFCALGKEFDLPDGGKAGTDLAMKAPGGAFEGPRKNSRKNPWLPGRVGS